MDKTEKATIAIMAIATLIIIGEAAHRIKQERDNNRKMKKAWENLRAGNFEIDFTTTPEN